MQEKIDRSKRNGKKIVKGSKFVPQRVIVKLTVQLRAQLILNMFSI